MPEPMLSSPKFHVKVHVLVLVPHETPLLVESLALKVSC
jgi:hypothetical protein